MKSFMLFRKKTTVGVYLSNNRQLNAINLYPWYDCVLHNVNGFDLCKVVPEIEFSY